MKKISSDTVFSVVRKTDNLHEICDMYKKALGFDILATFEDLHGYDGVILGHEELGYHLEFTNRPNLEPAIQSVADSYLVFYIADTQRWEWTCRAMIDAGFHYVEARNPYWSKVGKTFQDPDGYRLVIQNGEFGIGIGDRGYAM